MLRVTLLVLGMVLALGLVGLASDGSVAWPGTPETTAYVSSAAVEVPGEEPAWWGDLWRCTKACLLSCAPLKPLPPIYKACMSGCIAFCLEFGFAMLLDPHHAVVMV
jgi:hypothetical protein